MKSLRLKKDKASLADYEEAKSALESIGAKVVGGMVGLNAYLDVKNACLVKVRSLGYLRRLAGFTYSADKTPN